MHYWAENQKNEKKTRIPYRESKLTLFLRDCFDSIGVEQQLILDKSMNTDDENSAEEQPIKEKKPHTLVVIATGYFSPIYILFLLLMQIIFFFWNSK